MLHPLLRVVCLYAAGVLLGCLGGLRPAIPLLSLLGLAVVGATVKPLRPLLGPTLLIFAGWLNLTLHDFIWSNHDLRHLIGDTPVLAEVRGRLAETPDIRVRTRNGEPRVRTLCELNLTEVRIHTGSWMRATGRIAASSAGVLGPAFCRGQSVEVSGVLSRPDGPRAEGLFNYAAHLENRGVHFQLRADGPGEWAIASGSSCAPPLTDRFMEWARRTLSRGLPDDDPATGLVQAMTLGWKTALTDEVEEPFVRAGTMHLFAISGLHIALIAGMVLAILRLLRVPRGICGALLIPLLWFYTAATGWQASAVRATVMMTIILGGWSLRRPSNLLNSLSAAALLILLMDPRQLLQASFQLSFAVVLTLALLLPPLQEHVLRLLQPDPLLPAGLVPRWQRWAGKPLRWLLLMAATSLAAWLGSMPLTAHYFHLVSPGTLVANLLVVPCAGAALASALASLVTGAWWPWISEVFNHGAWFWMRVMMTISERVSELPGACRHVASPSAALLTIYYGTLLVLAFGWISTPGTKWFLIGSGLVMAGLLAGQIQRNRAAASVTALPLNGGLAVHLKMPGRTEPLLVDCGNTNAFNSVLQPFLQARGENRIGALVLSHGDQQHMGAAMLMLQQFKPERLGLSRVRFRSPGYRQLAKGPLPGPVTLTPLQTGDRFEGWSILAPPGDLKVRRADEGVVVLRGTLRGSRILLLSDLDRAGQRRLLDESPPDALRADIVITGLPGEGEPLIEDLLRIIHPALIVVGDDEWPARRRASARLLSRLRASGAQVFSTREHGTMTVRFHSGGWRASNAAGEILAASGPPACGWAD